MESNKRSSKRILNLLQVVALFLAASGAARAGDPPSIPVLCDKPSLLPTWGTIYGQGTLCFLGTDPRFGQAISVISVPIVPIIITFLGQGDFECNKYGIGCPVVAVSDPTQPLQVNPTSIPESSAVDAVLLSPIFRGQDFKLGPTDLGTNQWGEAIEKASFWNLNPNSTESFSPPFPEHPQATWSNWHVTLDPVLMPAQRLFVTYGNWSALPNNLYSINSNVLDPLLLDLMSQTSGSVMPIYLTYNVEENQNGTTAYSYHNWYKIGGHYTPFIWASWMDPGFSHPDIMPLSHEVAETMLDPFGLNIVPAWPAPYSFKLPWDPPYNYSSCQENLEVGDPLEDRTTAAELQFPIANSVMTYHFQNVATVSWFMQANPSFSVNGWYTLGGAVDGEFAAPAPACTAH